MVAPRSVLTASFIAAVAVIAAVTGTRSTVIDGRVMAADLLPELQAHDRRVVAIDCDREIEVGPDGATFRCTLTADDGSATAVEYTMSRGGSLEGRLVGVPRPPGP